MGTIAETWRRIVQWHRINTPGKAFAFPEGASREALAAVQASIGVALPEDVEMFYLMHNGSDGGSILPYGYDLLPIQSILSDWKMLSSVDNASLPASPPPQVEGPIRTQWWNMRWIPLTGNGGGIITVSTLTLVRVGLWAKSFVTHTKSARCV